EPAQGTRDPGHAADGTLGQKTGAEGCGGGRVRAAAGDVPDDERDAPRPRVEAREIQKGAVSDHVGASWRVQTRAPPGAAAGAVCEVHQPNRRRLLRLGEVPGGHPVRENIARETASRVLG